MGPVLLQMWDIKNGGKPQCPGQALNVPLRAHESNVWQCIRVADTEANLPAKTLVACSGMPALACVHPRNSGYACHLDVAARGVGDALLPFWFSPGQKLERSLTDMVSHPWQLSFSRV